MCWKKLTKNNVMDLGIFSEHFDFELFKAFIKENELISFKEDIGFCTSVLKFFKNGGKNYGKTYLQMQRIYGSDLIDHALFFKNKSGEVIFSSQPYADKNTIEKLFKDRFDDCFGLEIYDTSLSWYYPEKTILCVITLKK